MGATGVDKHTPENAEAVTVAGHRSHKLGFLVKPYPRAISTKRE